MSVKQQNVCLPPDEWAALRVLAQNERNGVISAAVSRLVAAEAERVLGSNWRVVVRNTAPQPARV